jgi:NAD(P)-dependent dehydrogenase (short-subunit alcohol dehydrogenase family)
MGKLHDQIAIITGAGGGIGRATALLFASQGAKLVLADWNADSNDETARLIQAQGGQAVSIQTDVTQESDIQAMIGLALSTFGRVDILMNNAGAGSDPAPIHETQTQHWDKVIAICLTGVFLGMKHALPPMLAQNSGNIINVASIAGIIGAPGLVAYAAAKAGVIEMTKTAAIEYSRYQIRCNAIAPGWTKTAMVEAYTGNQAEAEQRMLRGIPMRRFGEASEIAHAALFLAAKDAAFIQGQTIVLDGGITIQ